MVHLYVHTSGPSNFRIPIGEHDTRGPIVAACDWLREVRIQGQYLDKENMTLFPYHSITGIEIRDDR